MQQKRCVCAEQAGFHHFGMRYGKNLALEVHAVPHAAVLLARSHKAVEGYLQFGEVFAVHVSRWLVVVFSPHQT